MTADGFDFDWTVPAASSADATEPPAELRQAASHLFGIYSSMLRAGFNEDQAMALTIRILESNNR